MSSCLPDTSADVSATSCDVGFFFSVSYVVSLLNCQHVVVVNTTTYHTTSQKHRAKHLGVCRSLKIFATIDPKDTVDKLNKSKLTGNVNVNKMMLLWVCCWWWSCCFCLAENANNQPSQSVVRAGGGWRRERHRLNSSTFLSQPCLPTNHCTFFTNV